MEQKNEAASPEVAPEEGGDKRAEQPGSRIKSLRQAKGMSLKALALESGVSIGMLSQVERDLTNPSLRVLTKIREALGAPVTALFTDTFQPVEPSFVRRKGRRPILNLGYLNKELLSSNAPQNIQFMILHVPPSGTSGETPLSYPAEKGGYLLEGKLILSVGDQDALLLEGDSFSFDSQKPHSFRNPTKSDARVLWIIGSVPIERHL